MNIIFTPAIAGKQWNGATYHESALGGSETAVICLAREFARRGHEVFVYSHGQPGRFEDVTYLHISQLQAQGVPPCDVHVSSRWVDILFQTPAEALRVLWLHDIVQQRYAQLPADLIVCLTEFQANVWELLGNNWDARRLLICGDGVDTTQFTGFEERDPNRLIWISNPDRGLYIACKIFRDQILPRWPDLYLEVFGRYGVYGWPAETERVHMPPPTWLEDGSIRVREPLPHLGVARELMKSWALWYPTFWPETFCMAALEAQCAGTPVVTSLAGALPETVKGGIVTSDFTNAVSQLRNKNRWDKLSAAGKEFAATHSWPVIAATWERAIAQVMELEGEDAN